MADGPYRIERFASHHEQDSFSCGKPELDRYIRELAAQDLKRKVAVPFVAVPDGGGRVVGYYTLSALSVFLRDVPAAVAKKLPRYPEVPVTLLGRLAVDTSVQGRGLGEFLLTDGLNRALAASASVASFAVVVDPIDDAARAFYEHFEFAPLMDDDRRRLYLPMKSIALLFGD